MLITRTGSRRRAATTRSGNPRGRIGVHRLARAIGLLLLVPLAAPALELGEASLTSGLGQSLRVAIPYRVSGDEQIVAACVGLAAPQARDDLPTYVNVSRISVTPTEIQIFDERPVVEPLIGLNLEVHCPRTPHLLRSYQLLIDLPERMPALLANGPALAAERAQPALAAPSAAAPPRDAARASANEIPAATVAAAPPADEPVARPARASSSARARGLDGGTLPQGQTYRVVRGDTLSGIAARVAERPGTIAETADAIFAANAAAFTRGNPDLIEEGRSITIPVFAPAAASRTAPAAAVPAVEAPSAVAASAAAPSVAAAAVAREPEAAPAVPAAPPAAESAQGTPAASSAPDATPVAAPAASPPAPAAAPVAAPAGDATSQGPARAENAPAAPSRVATGGISSALLAALLAVAAIVASAAAVVFVRRRRPPEANPQAQPKPREPARRRPVDLAGGMDVVEGSLTGTHAAALRGAATATAVDVDTALQSELKALALDGGAVDFDVGAAGAANEGAEPSAAPAPVAVAADESPTQAATVRMMHDPASEATVRQQRPAAKPERPHEPADDDRHTLTVVELDLLRQDYEAEHTLTQQGSQALREALADLAATKAAHAATGETATLESPLLEDAAESTIDAPTARLRSK